MEFALHGKLVFNRILEVPESSRVRFDFHSDRLRIRVLNGRKLIKFFQVTYVLSRRYLRKFLSWLFPLRSYTMSARMIEQFLDFLYANCAMFNDFSLRFIFLEDETIIRIGKYEFTHPF